MSFVLILYIFAGWTAKGDSVALSSVTGFKTRAGCEAAGTEAKSLVSGATTKEYRFVCVESK